MAYSYVIVYKALYICKSGKYIYKCKLLYENYFFTVFTVYVLYILRSNVFHIEMCGDYVDTYYVTVFGSN